MMLSKRFCSKTDIPTKASAIFVITFSNINYGEYSIRSIINGRYETENAVYFTITNPNPEPEAEPQAENGENCTIGL
jgi:hypothetical protein